MTTLSNITVKKADGTTDVTYTALSPSAGYGNPAMFRSNSVGTSIASRPSLAVTPIEKVNRSLVKVNFVMPIVDPLSGKVVDYCSVKAEANFPLSASDDTVKEAAHQGTNLIASALIKSTMQEGIGPN